MFSRLKVLKKLLKVNKLLSQSSAVCIPQCFVSAKRLNLWLAKTVGAVYCA